MGTRSLQHQASEVHDGPLGASRFVSPDKSVSRDSVFSDRLWNMASLVSLPGVKGSQKLWDFGLAGC